MKTENFEERPDDSELEEQIVPVTPDEPKINPGVFNVPPKEDGDDDEEEASKQMPTIN